MFDQTAKLHLDRIRIATVNRLGRSDMAEWIQAHTFINGKNYSFKDHEWQLRVLQETANELVIIKSAQLGASELCLRMAAALTMTAVGKFACAYLFPSADFALNYSKTRFTPIVETSPTLKAAQGTSGIDSAELKTFGDMKSIAFKGTTSGTSALSHSLDAIFWDEFAFMEDQQVALDYESRLVHSQHRIKIKLSTPTFLGDPISSAFENTKRWRNMCRCDKCNEVFYPSFYDHVVIPEWNSHLDDINADNIHKVRYQDAVILCPKCGRAPSLQPEHRLWVCENPDDTYSAVGIKLSPFDVPNVVTVPYLIKASTSYASKARFRNFNLGMTAEDAESGLTVDDLEKAAVDLAENPFSHCVMGIDMGNTCWFTVGGVSSEGKFGLVHVEKVPLASFRERYWLLKAQYKVVCTVCDSQPMLDLVMSMCGDDPNFYGALYVTRQGLDFFEVRQRDPDAEKAQGSLRQVVVARSQLFDKLMSEVRSGRMWFRRTELWQLFKAHVTDMKRASSTLRNGEMQSLWVKSAKGNDHLFHSLGYCFIASQMRGMVHNSAHLEIFGVRRLKLKPQ